VVDVQAVVSAAIATPSTTLRRALEVGIRPQQYYAAGRDVRAAVRRPIASAARLGPRRRGRGYRVLVRGSGTGTGYAGAGAARLSSRYPGIRSGTSTDVHGTDTLYDVSGGPDSRSP
jgi:hypothetical protein